MAHAILSTGNDSTLPSNETHGGHGLHVASWNFDHVAEPFILSVFILAACLVKLGFHHAGFLSSKIPESCLLITAGTITGVILHFANVGDYLRLEPKTFMLYLLPPIILEASYSINDRVFAQNIGTILLFAVVGTLLAFFLIGPTLYGLILSGSMGQIQLSLTEALVFASLIVAVDPVAVLAIFQDVGVNNALYFLVFGESLLNDAVTIVLYNTMIVLAELEVVSTSQIGIAVASFFTVSLGGLSIGVIFGILSALITKQTAHVRVVEPLAIFVMAYLAYISAELFHWSGIISMIGCGLMQSQYALDNISRKSYTTVIYFVKMLSATFEAVIFLFLGLELVSASHVWHTGFILWSLFLCLLYRLIITFGLSGLANKIGRLNIISPKEQFIMWYGGLRGAVCFALVATLPDDFHLKNLFVTATLFIIMFTVFFQGITIKFLVNKLHIRKESREKSGIFEELNIRVSDHVMAGIEGVAHLHGVNFIREGFSRFEVQYLRRWLQVDPKSNDEKILVIYKEMQLSYFRHHIKPFIPGAKLPSLPKLHMVDSESSFLNETHTVMSPDPASNVTADFSNDEDIKDMFRSKEPGGLNKRHDRNLTREHETDLFKRLKEHQARHQRLHEYRRRQSVMELGDTNVNSVERNYGTPPSKELTRF